MYRALLNRVCHQRAASHRGHIPSLPKDPTLFLQAGGRKVQVCLPFACQMSRALRPSCPDWGRMKKKVFLFTCPLLDKKREKIVINLTSSMNHLSHAVRETLQREQVVILRSRGSEVSHCTATTQQYEKCSLRAASTALKIITLLCSWGIQETFFPPI